MTEVSIIIVHYKTPELTENCIQSFLRSDFQNFEIIVVDNNSNDGAGAQLKAKYSKLNWIYNDKNEGFGRANNLGISVAKGEYIFLINSDIEAHTDTISICLQEIKSLKKPGVLGCKLINKDGTDQNSQYFHSNDFKGILKDNILYNYLFYKKPSELKAVMGAFMVIPRNVIEKCGGFDPDFFMYTEEIELCHRIRSNDFKIHYTDKTSAIHIHGGSSVGSDWSLRQNLLSNALLFWKTRGLVGITGFHVLFQLNMVTNLILLWKLPKQSRKHYFRLNKSYLKNFFTFLSIPFKYKKGLGTGDKMLRLKL